MTRQLLARDWGFEVGLEASRRSYWRVQEGVESLGAQKKKKKIYRWLIPPPKLHTNHNKQ